MSDPNYFEILQIPPEKWESITEDELRAAKNQAATNYTKTALYDSDAKKRTQAEKYKPLVDKAFKALATEDARKKYIVQLKQQAAQSEIEGIGQIEVKFSLGGRHKDLNLSVTENPVTTPLRVGTQRIQYIQEYVCRSFEIPQETGIPALQDRSLERWLRYSANEADIANIIRYYQVHPTELTSEELLFVALDLLQTRYPAPIIPTSAPHVLEMIKTVQQPGWIIEPQIVNFDLLPKKDFSVTVSVKGWQKRLGNVTATVDNPAVRIDDSKLKARGFLDVIANGTDMKGGETLRATITLRSDTLGEKQIPVYGIRGRFMGMRMFNGGAAKEHNLAVANKAKEFGMYELAAELFSDAGVPDQAKDAEFKSISASYRRHEWLALIRKARAYSMSYGREPRVTAMVVEALRLIGGTYYQLDEPEIALPYLATLVLESSQLPNRKLPESAWTLRPEAQVKIDPAKPKTAWVEVTEKLGLNWTHPSGTVDKSHYAGPRPVELQNRIVFWRVKHQVKPPIVVYQGMIVACRRDNRAILGVDAATGDILWQHTMGLNGKDFASPVCGNNMVYAADPKGVVYALDIFTGALKWQTQLSDSRDLELALSKHYLVVLTGQQALWMDPNTGTITMSGDKMRGLFRGANPVNLIVSDDCVLFQKATMMKKTMNFIDMRTGSELVYDIPYDIAPPVTWAAYEGELYLPYMLNYQMKCLKSVDSNGHREYETVTWQELGVNVYDVRRDRPILHNESPIIGRTYYQQNNQCDVTVKARKADIVAMAPARIQTDGKHTSIGTNDGHRPHNFIIAAAFGNEVFYWVRLDDRIELFNARTFDTPVQTIMFADILDVVVTERSFSASLIGQVGSEYAVSWDIPNEVRPITGSPAIYGEVIYAVTQSGDIAAIGR